MIFREKLRNLIKFGKAFINMYILSYKIYLKNSVFHSLHYWSTYLFDLCLTVKIHSFLILFIQSRLHHSHSHSETRKNSRLLLKPSQGLGLIRSKISVIYQQEIRKQRHCRELAKLSYPSSISRNFETFSIQRELFHDD